MARPITLTVTVSDHIHALLMSELETAKTEREGITIGTAGLKVSAEVQAVTGWENP